MAVKIRLRRMGAKQAPSYRIVAADSRYPRDGRFIESIGYYNPTTNPITLKVDKELALKWLNQGAQPSDTVKNLLSMQGIMKEYHDAKYAKKAKDVKKEEVKEEVKAEAEEKPAKKATTKKFQITSLIGRRTKKRKKRRMGMK